MKIFYKLFAFFFTLLSITAQAQESNHILNKGWQFSKQGANKWYPAQVPGTIHTDLFLNKQIPDPYYRDNEKKLKWIDTKNWDYKNSFAANASLLGKKNIELIFDGLDTYTDVYLNGQLILSSDNMFRQWRVDVKNILKAKNELLIRFYSAKNKVD